jgi:hypothetical protein
MADGKRELAEYIPGDVPRFEHVARYVHREMVDVIEAARDLAR